jgi:predicted kinase
VPVLRDETADAKGIASVSGCTVIVNGAPGTGKTTLARRLAQDLALPLISKDDIKERLFDHLGWQDRAWSIKLGGASFELLFYFVESQLAAGRSLVVETAFIPRFHTPRFLELIDRYDFQPVQVLCAADVEVLFERFTGRTATGERHPGHVDHLATFEQFAQVVQGDKYGRLEIGGPLIEVDTTDLERVNYVELLRQVRALLQ